MGQVKLMWAGLAGLLLFITSSIVTAELAWRVPPYPGMGSRPARALYQTGPRYPCNNNPMESESAALAYYFACAPSDGYFNPGGGCGGIEHRFYENFRLDWEDPQGYMFNHWLQPNRSTKAIRVRYDVRSVCPSGTTILSYTYNHHISRDLLCPDCYGFEAQESDFTQPPGSSGPWPAPNALVCNPIRDNSGFPRCLKDGTCGVGNPVFPDSRRKHQAERDIDLPGNLFFERTYDSTSHGDWAARGLLGRGWTHNFDRRLRIEDRPNYSYVERIGPRPHAEGFTRIGGNYVGDSDTKDRVYEAYANSTLVGWDYVDGATENVERYDTQGRLLSITSATGHRLSLAYYPATFRIASVSDPHGRLLSFTYDSLGRVQRVTDPQGGLYDYAYSAPAGSDNGRLLSVTYPHDSLGVRATRQYHYENANYPYLLTGITDENGWRFATYLYSDGSPEVTETRHNASATVAANRYRFAPGGVVTDPLGTTRTYAYITVAGANRDASVSQPCPSCGGNAASSQTYDSNGNVSSRTDFIGRKSCFEYDMSRNLETARVEGALSGESCTTLLSALTLPNRSDVRRVSTSWHPFWRLPSKLAEPKRVTSYVYNGDTVSGVAVNCAPTGISVAGRPIAVLCRKLEQESTDSSGESGINPPVSGPIRAWSYTYNEHGQVVTETDPSGKVKSTTYFAANEPVGKRGSVATVEQANAGVVFATTFTAYSPNGLPLSWIDAAGAPSSRTYHSRGWVTSRTDGTETSIFDYDKAGLLSRATRPDGSFESFIYDGAHRLIAKTDGTGSSVFYELDAIGNRVVERRVDALGNLTAVSGKVIDSLNRVHQEVGGATTFADVTPVDSAVSAIEMINVAGVTVGCATSPRRYCPNDVTTRLQMVIFLLRAKYNTSLPPLPSAAPAGFPFADTVDPWVWKAFQDGIVDSSTGLSVAGQCPTSAATTFCGSAPIARDVMAKWLLRAARTPTYAPPVPVSPVFADMTGNVYQAWAEQAYVEKITTGCGSNASGQLLYCPSSFVTRAAMALFLTRSFPQFIDPVPLASEQYCSLGTTYSAANYSLPGCVSGTCWSGAPFYRSKLAAGTSYPNTHYTCANKRYVAGGVQSTLNVYDANGNRTESNSPSGRRTVTSYDALGRPIEVNEREDPGGALLAATTYQYDKRNQLVQVTDPRLLATVFGQSGFGDTTHVSSPDTGVGSSAFNSIGNVVTRVDARGVVETRTYDDLHRLSQAEFSKVGAPTETRRFFYDGGGSPPVTYSKGRLHQIIDDSGATTYTYDMRGRVKSKTQTVGYTKTVSYGYSTSGNLISLTTPSGQAISYGYANGRVSSVTVNGTSLLSGVEADPFGPIAAWQWGNGRFTYRDTDLAGRVTVLEYRGSSPLLKSQILWDASNRVTSVADTLLPANGGTYQYDPLDRLTVARWGSPAVFAQHFTYDPVGNRASKDGDGLGSPDVLYTYSPTSNRLLAQSGVESKAYSYDPAGNAVAMGGLTYEYNLANRLKSVKNGAATVAAYRYNALGQRVEKVVGVTTARFWYDESGRLLGEYDGAGNLVQEFVWLENLPVAVLRPTGAGGVPPPVNIFYIHIDHLGSPRAITRPSDDALMWQWPNSDAFGANAANASPSGQAAFSFPLRFPGQYYDGERGLHYNYFRDYDPTIGRYVESDPIGLMGGVNTFAYVNSNPLKFFDSRGLAAQLCSRWFYPVPVPYARHCFIQYTDGGSSSFDHKGVHADPAPSWWPGTCAPTKGDPADDCVKREMEKCKASEYDFTSNNCCHCAEQALKACGLSFPNKDWPNWPVNPGPQPR